MTTDLNAKSILNNAMSTLRQIDFGGSAAGTTATGSNFTNSIFTLAENGMAAVEGGDEQKANAIANMVQGLLDMLSNISFSETTKANQVNKKNEKKIDEIDKNNKQTIQETEAKVQQITTSIAGSSNEILKAMEEIEKLGGDKGLIQTAQVQLEEQLKIIEENQAILNGEKKGDKNAALAAIEGASGQISTLVGNVQGYRALIEAQNANVANAVNSISQQISESATVIQEGLDKVQGNVANMQQQGVVNTQVVAQGGIDKATGKALEATGEAMTKTPATAATGSQAIVKGGIKSNTGDAEIKGATQNLTQVTASIGQMGTDLTNMANFANAVGKVGESAVELVGQYEAVLNPVITAIGSFANIESGNEALTGAINQYKAQLNSNENTDENNAKEEKEENINATNIKFQFDRKAFEVKKEA